MMTAKQNEKIIRLRSCGTAYSFIAEHLNFSINMAKSFCRWYKDIPQKHPLYRANAAEDICTRMETNGVNIAAASAAPPTVSKAVAAMSTENFKNEKLCQTTMHLAGKMFEDGIISEEGHRQTDTIFLEEYRPVFSILFSESAC